MIDLHVHLLPGLDDGPETLEASLQMCRQMVADGIHVAATTPHMSDGQYNVRPEQVREGCERLRQALAAENIALELVVGGDVHLEPDVAEQVRDGRVLTLADTGRYLLVELPTDIIPQHLADVLFHLELQRVVPIITHPERIWDVQKKPECLRPFVEQGCLIQITAKALDDQDRPDRACARKLLEHGYVHLVASDAHSPGPWRAPGLSQARQTVINVLGPEEAEEIFNRRPRQVLDGARIEVPPPRPIRRGGLLGWLR